MVKITIYPCLAKTKASFSIVTPQPCFARQVCPWMPLSRLRHDGSNGIFYSPEIPSNTISSISRREPLYMKMLNMPISFEISFHATW